MKDQEYVTVPCRVPAGLLKDGETLMLDPKCWRHPSGTLMQHGSATDCIIIPAFDPNEWAAKNLPKPACEREVWAGKCAMGWRMWADEPRTSPITQGYFGSKDNADFEMLQPSPLMGNDPFNLPWYQSKFKWAKCECSTLHEGGIETHAGAVWCWVWQGVEA